ncbi:hypothetical protein WMF18_38585 [Sorangium sp. So ce315]|uniref:hypothetical protein n=1 Tax=Sorangium sp. So ce315 TaxID=3133299 RepID=UPI003F638A8B
MRLVARLTTHAFSAGVAGISFSVQPLPGSDQLFVIPIQHLLAASLAKERGSSLSKAAWSQVHQLIWGGGALRLMIGLTLGLIPLAGAVTNAITAFVSTCSRASARAAWPSWRSRSRASRGSPASTR